MVSVSSCPHRAGQLLPTSNPKDDYQRLWTWEKDSNANKHRQRALWALEGKRGCVWKREGYIQSGGSGSFAPSYALAVRCPLLRVAPGGFGNPVGHGADGSSSVISSG